MATYFKSDAKLTVSNIVDYNLLSIVPASGNGLFNIYTCPSGKYALFQLIQCYITGSTGLSLNIRAQTRGRSYTGTTTLIKTFATSLPAFGLTSFDAQSVTYHGVPQLDPFTYLRNLESLLTQAESNAYCALLGPNDFANVATGGFDPDNSMQMSFRAYEFDIL